MEFSQNPSLLADHLHFSGQASPELQFSDYFVPGYVFDDELLSWPSESDIGSSSSTTNANQIISTENVNEVEENTDYGSLRFVFRTKSDLEIMDDGFRWRKYGKKKIKNNHYLRNYFRCTNVGCKVKKRVERDSEDPSYVITTYVGIHNHESPSHLSNYAPTHSMPSTLQLS